MGRKAENTRLSGKATRKKLWDVVGTLFLLTSPAEAPHVYTSLETWGIFWLECSLRLISSNSRNSEARKWQSKQPRGAGWERGAPR